MTAFSSFLPHPKFLTMAEKALKKVADQLKCSICLDDYTDPKLLHCLHAFCRTCLVKLVSRNEQGLLFLSCPNCRYITPVPTNGVADLRPAFHINHLLDIAEDLKREKEAPASTERADSSSGSLPSPRKEVSTFCSEHVKEELKLFCETCGELICPYCALKNGKHHNHDYELIGIAFETYKKEMSSLLEPINKNLISVDEILTQFDKCNGKISDQRAAIEADIHDIINELHQVLDIRRTELISRLHQLTQWKLKDLAAERDQAEYVHAQLSSCQDFMKLCLETDRWGEALKMKTTVLKQAKELTTTVQPDVLKPNTKADIVLSASADITDLCRHIGEMSTPASAVPSKCHATGEGLQLGVVGRTSTAVLQVCNSKGEPCSEPLTSLECKLVSELTGATATGSFKKLEGQNLYEISYQPTIKGRHRLSIKIGRQHIRESPFHPAVTSSVSNLSAPIHTIACPGVNSPCGIAIDHRGRLVVSERVSERVSGYISTYAPSGKKIKTLDLKGLKIFGLALDGRGNIIISENTNNSVTKYSPECRSRLLVSFGTKGGGQLQLSGPRGIAVNTSNNKVYVADYQNHRIQVLNSDLTYSHTFGKQGEGKGQFNYPSAVTCDGAGDVYVADSSNNRIQVFSAEGVFLRVFGKGTKCPHCISFDPSYKHLYISEANNHRISVFTSGGECVTSFGEDVEQFCPAGLAADSNGVVYVCD